MERSALLSAELGIYPGWRLRIPIHAAHRFQRTSATHSNGTRSPFLSSLGIGRWLRQDKSSGQTSYMGKLSNIVSRPGGRQRFSMSTLNRSRSPWTR